MDTDPLVTREAAAPLVKRNRRTVSRAVADVPPEDPGPPKRWRVSTILAALGRHEVEARLRQHGDSSSGSIRESLRQLHADQIAALVMKIDAKFARLAAEPDMDRRFELAQAQGLEEVGELDRILTASLAAVDPILAPLLRAHCNEILRQTLGTLGNLLDLDFAGVEEEPGSLPVS